MKGGFHESMTFLHTWTGLLMGWLLFAMFLTGTAAVFQNETTIWMTPEMGRSAPPAQAIALAEARLKTVAPTAASWSIDPPDERTIVTTIGWKADKAHGGKSGTETLESATGKPVSLRATRGGEFFYHFHYRFETPSRTLWWLSGFAAVVMLAGLTTGVLIHRRIFRNFFTFRPRKASQRSWLDAHNFLAVLALPFHFLITYSGLLVILGTVMPFAAIATYSGGKSLPEAFVNFDPVRSAYSAGVNPAVAKPKPVGIATPLTPLVPVIEQAHARWGGGRVGRIDVVNPGDAHAQIEVVRHGGDQLSHRPDRLIFDGATGAYQRTIVDRGPVEVTRAVIYGMHMAHFAGWALRWAYFILGMAGVGLIGTGLIYWTQKRAPKRDTGAPLPLGHRLVHRLNVGVIAGLPVAMVAIFWANRLLPADMPGRSEMEINWFYWTWFAMAGLSAVRPVRRAWVEILSLAAVAYAGVPILDAVTTHKGIADLLRPGEGIVAGFDLTMLATGLLFAYAVAKVMPMKTVEDPPVAALGEGAA